VFLLLNLVQGILKKVCATFMPSYLNLPRVLSLFRGEGDCVPQLSG